MSSERKQAKEREEKFELNHLQSTAHVIRIYTDMRCFSKVFDKQMHFIVDFGDFNNKYENKIISE